MTLDSQIVGRTKVALLLGPTKHLHFRICSSVRPIISAVKDKKNLLVPCIRPCFDCRCVSRSLVPVDRSIDREFRPLMAVGPLICLINNTRILGRSSPKFTIMATHRVIIVTQDKRRTKGKGRTKLLFPVTDLYTANLHTWIRPPKFLERQVNLSLFVTS